MVDHQLDEKMMRVEKQSITTVVELKLDPYEATEII